jgi:hypothetical protein
MQPLCLSFIDEEQALPILYTYVPIEYGVDENGNATQEVATEAYYKPNYQNISTLGVVYKRAPKILPPDYEPEPYPAPNWGVNVLLLDGEDIEPLRPYICEPKNPIRVWAT